MARLMNLGVAWVCTLAGMERATADTLFVAGKGGIYALHFAPESGRLGPPVLAAKLPSPAGLATHPSGWFLFATFHGATASGPGPGHLASFFVDPNTGTLLEISQVETGGSGPAQVEVDARRAAVFVANDQGGSVAGFPLGADGKLGPRKLWIQHEGSSVIMPRQAAPHPQQVRVSPGGQHVYVPDVGTDEVFIYAFGEGGVLHPASTPTAKVEEGEGPCRLDFHPRLPMVYLANELSSRITAFRRDGQNGSLTALQSLRSMPWGYQGCTSELRVHPSGEFLYACNPGHHSIEVFRLDAQGFLSLVQHRTSGGKAPRHFTIHASGRWLIAGNQDAGTLVVFSIDSKTGKLEAAGDPAELPAPACLVFAPEP